MDTLLELPTVIASFFEDRVSLRHDLRAARAIFLLLRTAGLNKTFALVPRLDLQLTESVRLLREKARFQVFLWLRRVDLALFSEGFQALFLSLSKLLTLDKFFKLFLRLHTHDLMLCSTSS